LEESPKLYTEGPRLPINAETMRKNKNTPMTPRQLKQWEIDQIELYCKGELPHWKEKILVDAGLNLPLIKRTRNPDFYGEDKI
jgi:hypothetical protein